MKSSKLIGLAISGIGILSLILSNIEEEQNRKELKAELKDELLTELKEEES